MIELKEHKQLTEDKPITRAPLPKQVFIHLSQHLGKIASPLVKIGDVVLTSQAIGSAQGNVSSNIHTSISGKVIKIEDYPHPALVQSQAVVIESDGEDKSQIPNPESQIEIEDLSSQQIREIIFNAGIVGMGGAAFPTHVKLNPPKPVEALIINCAECEPYLTCDYRLMLEKTEQIMRGIELVLRCLNAKKVYIAIEDNKPQAIKAFNRQIQNAKFEMRILKSSYPQGGERQLIKNILGKEVPSGKLPFDVGVVVHNVATVYAIYEAVYKNKPLYERVVTVTGSCLENPRNILARIGTPIKELINECGPLKEEPAKIIMGGPMMGIAQATDNVPIIKATGGILLLTKDEVKVLEEEVCIRCAACLKNCPVGLMPSVIDAASRKENWQLAAHYGALECIECGVCSFVCPANRFLVQSIKIAKLHIRR